MIMWPFFITSITYIITPQNIDISSWITLCMIICPYHLGPTSTLYNHREPSEVFCLGFADSCLILLSVSRNHKHVPGTFFSVRTGEVKLFLCMPLRHVGGVDLNFHPFVNLSLHVCDSLASGFDLFTPGEIYSGMDWKSGLVGPRVVWLQLGAKKS